MPTSPTCCGPSPLTMLGGCGGGGGEVSIGMSGLSNWPDSSGEVCSAMTPSSTLQERHCLLLKPQRIQSITFQILQL